MNQSILEKSGEEKSYGPYLLENAENPQKE